MKKKLSLEDRSRVFGKTRAIIEMAASTNGVIIVANEQAKQFYLKYAERLGLKMRTPIIAGEFFNEKDNNNQRGF